MRNNAASIIGNGVISLLWQLWCHCNPDHDKFLSLSNTTVVAIFPNVCLWRRSLCSNLAGIDPEKLYRGTFICQEGLCCCIVWPSFLFDCFVKIWATCMNFCPYAYAVLGEWNLRQFWNITSGIYAKYHVQIMLLFVYTTTRNTFVIFTCRYFKLSWNTTALSQSYCRNFSCSSIIQVFWWGWKKWRKFSHFWLA